MERARQCESDLQEIMRKYAGYGAFERYGYTDLESAYFPSFLQSESLHDNYWRQPLDPLWSGEDGHEIRRFYEEHVAINKQSWQKNCEYVDRLLSYIFDEIQDQSRVYKYLQLHHFVRQGSSREGLKISAANEFDVVLPFTFMGMITKVEKSPEADLPAGVAEICVPSYFNYGEIKPAGLITHKNGKRYVDTHVLHETLFKSLVDKTLQKIRTNSMSLGSDVYKINRKSGPTAIALEMTVSEPGQDVFLSVDIVPGFDFAGTSAKHRKFLVTRWIPEARNVTFATPYPRPNTAWRISHSHYEMHVFETWCNNTNAQRLVTAYRILKGIRETDVIRDPSSQLASVLKSYHLKNILLFALLYLTKLKEKHINSVTEAMNYLVAMFRICLEKKSLPQFFASNPALRKFFPGEDFHSSLRVNLFGEMRDSIDQIMRSFDRAVVRFGIHRHVSQDFMQLFENHVCNKYATKRKFGCKLFLIIVLLFFFFLLSLELIEK